MRLKKLRLRNFRNHTDSTLDFGNSTFALVRGSNGAGKSSLGQAVSVNLAQTTMGLAIDGKGYTSKIRDGEKQAEVIAEIQGQHILENTVTLSLGSSGRTQEVKCLDAPEDGKAVKGFENFLSRYRDALRISLNTDAFAGLSDKEQKDLLAKLVLPQRYDFPKDKVEAVNGLLDTAIDFNAEPFAVIELAYKKLYKERESCNRQVKDFVMPEALPIPKGVDSESLNKQLGEVRESRAKLQKQRDEAVAKANEIEVNRAKLQAKIDELLRKVEDGKKKLAVLDSNILPDIEKQKAIAARAEELAALRKQHTTLHAGLILVNEQIDRLRAITEKGSTCPTCDQAIDSVKIAAVIVDIQKENDATDAILQELDKKIEAIGDCAAAKIAVDRHEQAIKDKAELTKSLTETVEEGKTTRTALNALPPKQDATLPFSDPLGDLQSREEKIVEQQRPVIAAEERAKDIKAKTEQFEKLEAKAKTLQDLVVYFDKDGIKKTLIADHIGSFQNRLNAVLGAWGYQAALATDLSSFDVTTPRGYVGSVKEISGAEEYRFKVAFQCAVSSAAGIKLVVIDETEELGEDVRQPLYRSVFQLIQEGALEQAILIGYSLDKTVPKPQAPGSSYWFVENGEVERLG